MKLTAREILLHPVFWLAALLLAGLASQPLPFWQENYLAFWQKQALSLPELFFYQYQKSWFLAWPDSRLHWYFPLPSVIWLFVPLFWSKLLEAALLLLLLRKGLPERLSPALLLAALPWFFTNSYFLLLSLLLLLAFFQLYRHIEIIQSPKAISLVQGIGGTFILSLLFFPAFFLLFFFYLLWASQNKKSAHSKYFWPLVFAISFFLTAFFYLGSATFLFRVETRVLPELLAIFALFPWQPASSLLPAEKSGIPLWHYSFWLVFVFFLTLAWQRSSEKKKWPQFLASFAGRLLTIWLPVLTLVWLYFATYGYNSLLVFQGLLVFLLILQLAGRLPLPGPKTALVFAGVFLAYFVFFIIASNRQRGEQPGKPEAAVWLLPAADLGQFPFAASEIEKLALLDLKLIPENVERIKYLRWNMPGENQAPLFDESSLLFYQAEAEYARQTLEKMPADSHYAFFLRSKIHPDQEEPPYRRIRILRNENPAVAEKPLRLK